MSKKIEKLIKRLESGQTSIKTNFYGKPMEINVCASSASCMGGGSITRTNGKVEICLPKILVNRGGTLLRNVLYHEIGHFVNAHLDDSRVKGSIFEPESVWAILLPICKFKKAVEVSQIVWACDPWEIEADIAAIKNGSYDIDEYYRTFTRLLIFYNTIISAEAAELYSITLAKKVCVIRKNLVKNKFVSSYIKFAKCFAATFKFKKKA